MALLLALLSAFVIGIGLVMAVYVGITKVPAMLAQRKLQSRLEELSVPLDQPSIGDGALLKVSDAGPLPALERMISGTERGSAFGRWIEQSGLKVSISGVLLIAAVSGAICAILVTMSLKGSLNNPALHATPTSVNEPHFAEACFVSGVHVLFDN